VPDGQRTGGSGLKGLVVPFTIQLAGLSVAVTLPLWLLVATRWPQSLDFAFYALALDQFSAQVWAGDWYPRWLTDVNAGLGSPVFLFYSPGVYWLGSAFEWLAPRDVHGFGRLVLLLQLAVVAAGLSAHHWLRRHWPEPEARAGALAYAACPYLALKIYSSFGVAELWAIACLPLLLLATERRMFWGLAAGYAALALLHLPSCLVFAAVPVAYAAWGGGARAAARAVGAGLVGAALAAFYLVPAVMNRPFIAEQHFLEGRFDYRQNFSHPDAVLAAILTLLPVLWLAVRLPREQWATPWRAGATRFWVAEVLAACVMMTPLSVRLWDALPPLQYLQFPLRFFTALIPGIVWLEGRFLAVRPFPGFRLVVTTTAYIVVIVGAGLPAFVTDATPLRRYFDQRVVAAPEYQTRWMAESNLAPWALPPEILQSSPAALASGYGRVEVEQWGSRRIVLRTMIETPQAQVRLKTAYFPGWTAGRQGNQVEPVDGLLGVMLHQGQERVELLRPYFPGEREGLAISLVTLGAMLVAMAIARMNATTSPGPR
jgi:hypothetical protein